MVVHVQDTVMSVLFMHVILCAVMNQRVASPFFLFSLAAVPPLVLAGVVAGGPPCWKEGGGGFLASRREICVCVCVCVCV